MKASGIMTRKVVTVRQDSLLFAAVDLMLKHGISGLPVVDADGRVVGILTEGDLLRRAETGTERHRSRWMEFLLGTGKLADEYVHSHGRMVENVMTRDVATVTVDAELPDVVALMEKKKIKRVPVLKDGRLVGLVSRADLLRYLAGLGLSAPRRVEDGAIDRTLRGALDRQPWFSGSLVGISVVDGVVHYSGLITDEAQRRALVVAARNIPGVTKVDDKLSWVEPISGAVIPPPGDVPA